MSTARALPSPLCVTALILASLAAGVLLPAAETRDPLTPVKPRSRPSFRSLLSPAEFEQRSAPYAERIDTLKTQLKQNAPAFGRRITGVFASGWAAKNDVQPGDVITKVGGVRLWGDNLPEFGPTTPIELYRPATDKLRTVRVDEEGMGVQLAAYWHPENLYLGTNRQGSRWDGLVLLGILARGDDPDLAETAFKKAVDAGYRADVVADQVGAEIALCQNRPDVAAEFAAFVPWNSRNESEDIYPLLLYRVAMASFQWQRAKDIVLSDRTQFDSLSPVGPVRQIEIHKSRSAAQRALPPPSQRAEQMRRIDLTDRFVGSNRSVIEHRQRDLREGKPLRMAVQTAHFNSLPVETPEPITNLEFTIRFSGKATDELLDRYMKWFVVRVYAVTGPDEAQTDVLFDPQLTMFAIMDTGDIRVGCGNTYSEAYFTDPTVESLNNREHEFRLLKFGGQLELFLNGHRILYGVVSEGEYPLQFELIATGTTIDVHSVRLAEYVEEL